MFTWEEMQITNFLDALRARYRQSRRDVQFLPFTYGTEFSPLAVGVSPAVSVSQPTSTDQDADFVCFKTMQSAMISGGSTFVQFPNILVSLRDDVSGRTFQDKDIMLYSVFGHGKRGFYWPRPWIVPAKGSWTVTLTNLDIVNAFVIRLAFHGVKVYPIPFRG